MIVNVALTIYVQNEVSDDWSEDDIRFRIEEGYCNSNYINELAELIGKDGACNICSRSEAKYLGKATEAEIERGHKHPEVS